MSRLNMDGSQTENFRYTMAALQLEKKNKRRIISNIDKLSVEVGRSPEFLVAFFDFELYRTRGIAGCHLSPDGDAVVPEGGDIDQATLQRALLDFIQKYVMCPVCANNPETQFDSFQGRQMVLRCISCGGTAAIRHSISTEFLEWMQSNPQHLKRPAGSHGAASLKPPPDPYRFADGKNSDGWDFPPGSDSAGSSSGSGWVQTPLARTGSDSAGSSCGSGRAQ